MNESPVRVLLVDDDEDDYVITRDLICEMGARRYKLDWINNYAAGLAAVHRLEHDVCLLDYRLGEFTGLQLLRESQTLTLRPPMILLTGQGDHEIDLEAMKAGAADYLIKGQLNANQLDRAIRYAIEHKRSEERLRRERDLISRIMETSPVGIVVADQSGKITFANHCAEDVLGLTREAIARVMGVELRRDPELLEVVRGIFAARGREMSPSNARQADLPEGARPIPQTRGPAPGLICPVGDQVVYALPGVPDELREMVARAVLPDLRARSGDVAVIVSRTLRTWGYGESKLAEMVTPRLEALDAAGQKPAGQ